jgi:hypothetical protein
MKISKSTKNVLLYGGIGIAALAVYEFSSNAGTTAGTGIGEGIGSGIENTAEILAVVAVIAIGAFILL